MTQPSLTITKGVNDATVEPGQVFTYTVQVTNASGPDVSAAFDVTVTDNVPAGVIVNPASLVAAGGVLTGTNPDGSDGTITWTIPGPLQPGASQKFTYSAKLAASPTINATGKRNTADVGTYYSLPADYEFGFPDSPDGPLDRREYNGPSASRTVTPQFPALTAVKTAPNGPIAYVGDEFTWQFTVTNSGTGAAQDVDLIDVLPPNWRYEPDSASVTFGSAGSQALNPATSLDGVVQTLTWTNAGNLGVGQQATVTFRAVPLPAATTNPGAGSSIAHTNTVRATADDASGASGNLTGPYQSNLATAVARIHAADVAIAKTAGDFVAGATGTFRLIVSNNGPDPAVGPFLVTDPLPATPAGLSYVSAQGTGWSCSLLPVAGTPGTVQCYAHERRRHVGRQRCGCPVPADHDHGRRRRRRGVRYDVRQHGYRPGQDLRPEPGQQLRPGHGDGARRGRPGDRQEAVQPARRGPGRHLHHRRDQPRPEREPR